MFHLKRLTRKADCLNDAGIEQQEWEVEANASFGIWLPRSAPLLTWEQMATTPHPLLSWAKTLPSNSALPTWFSDGEKSLAPENEVKAVKLARSSIGLLTVKPPAEPEFYESFVQIWRAFYYGVRVGIALKPYRKDPGGIIPERLADVARDMSITTSAFHQAWDLLTPEAGIVGTRFSSNLGAAATALGKFAPQLGQELTQSTFLTLQSLLAFVLDEKLGQPVIFDGYADQSENILPMLFVSGEGKNLKGHRAGCVAERIRAPFATAFLDPVTIGPRVLDKKMLRSLRIAACVSKPILQKHPKVPGINDEVALRLGFGLGGNETIELQGDSGGGVACANAIGTSLGNRHNQNVTGSFEVKCDEYKEDAAPHRGAELWPENLGFGSVDSTSLSQKLKAAAEQPDTVVYLHESQNLGPDSGPPLKDWKDDQERIAGNGLKIKAIGGKTSFLQFLDDLTGDERINRVIRTNCLRSLVQWQVSTRPKNISLTESNATNPGLDAKQNCALKPINGTISAGEQVPQFFADTWDQDAIDRLLHSNQSRLWLSVSNRNASSYLHVREFTARLHAYLSSHEGQAKHFGTKSVLVVHWTNDIETETAADWPSDYERALADRLSEDCRSVRIAPDSLVSELLRHKRVCIILEATEKPDARRLEQLKQFVDSLIGTVPTAAKKNCRLIVVGKLGGGLFRKTLLRGQWDILPLNTCFHGRREATSKTIWFRASCLVAILLIASCAVVGVWRSTSNSFSALSAASNDAKSPDSALAHAGQNGFEATTSRVTQSAQGVTKIVEPQLLQTQLSDSGLLVVGMTAVDSRIEFSNSEWDTIMGSLPERLELADRKIYKDFGFAYRLAKDGEYKIRFQHQGQNQKEPKHEKAIPPATTFIFWKDRNGRITFSGTQRVRNSRDGASVLGSLDSGVEVRFWMRVYFLTEAEADDFQQGFLGGRILIQLHRQ